METRSSFRWMEYHISAIGWTLLPSLWFHFFFEISGHKIRVVSFKGLLIYIPAFLFLTLTFLTKPVVQSFLSTPLGTVEIQDYHHILTLLFHLYYIVFVSIGIFVALHKMLTTHLKAEKQRLKIILLSGIPTFSLILLFNTILPLIGKIRIPALGAALNLFFIPTIWVAIRKYRLLEINPTIAIDEILSRILDAVILLNPKNEIVRINETVESLSRYTDEELIGQKLSAICPELDNALRKEFSEHSFRYLSIFWDTPLQTRYNEKISFNFYASRIFNTSDDWIGTLLVGQDLNFIKKLESEISRREATEQLLLLANHELEHKVAERTMELQELASKDPLTGLANRRMANEFLENQIQRSLRRSSSFCIAFLDMDDLKKINDHFGHQFGDQALLHFAKILKKSLRKSDIAARIGGDEFLLILPDYNHTKIEKIQIKILQEVKKFNDNAILSFDLSFSIGTVSFDPEKHHSAESLILEADQLMYKEKKGKKSVKSLK